MYTPSYEDLPVAILSEEGSREILLLALMVMFREDPVAFYNKYIHSRRSKIEIQYDNSQEPVERTPSEEVAHMDEIMRKND